MPRPTHDDLVRRCTELTRQAMAAVSRAAGPELLSLDLTMGQFKAMVTVTVFGPQAVGELGRRLGISEPAASLLVDKLEELGLASRERDPQDRRRSLVTATPEAEQLAQRLRQGRDEQLLAWLQALRGDELEALAVGLRGLLRASAEQEAAAEAEVQRV